MMMKRYKNNNSSLEVDHQISWEGRWQIPPPPKKLCKSGIKKKICKHLRKHLRKEKYSCNYMEHTEIYRENSYTSLYTVQSSAKLRARKVSPSRVSNDPSKTDGNKRDPGSFSSVTTTFSRPL
jgi:hypothetical protein